MKTESDIEQSFVKWVSENGGVSWKWTGSRYKFDRIFVTPNGHVGIIEFKTPRGKLTVHQNAMLESLKKRKVQNARIWICKSLQAAKRVFMATYFNQVLRDAHDRSLDYILFPAYKIDYSCPEPKLVVAHRFNM